ncbi:Protein SRG1 (AtSRG1) (Protein SENESCENCE-RELATED GENE 1), partial [Durusdinium trenchii]
MTGFAEMLDLPPETFAQCFEGHDMGTIRLLRYPPAETPEEAARRQVASYGISPHTDFEAFTLMHQSAAGLQFLKPGGRAWLDAPVKKEEFVVIVGDVLERFTNGVLRATPHRVLQTEWERFSIIRFNAMRPETLIQPLPEFISKSRPARYTPVTMQKHMDTTLTRLERGLGAWEKELETPVERLINYHYPSQYVVQRLRKGQDINIDGHLEEDAWSEVPWLDDFLDLAGPRFDGWKEASRDYARRFTGSSNPTRVKLRWDDAFLYVAAELRSRSVSASVTGHCADLQSEVWPKPVLPYFDDDFEVFIDESQSNYFYVEFELNA